jgi:hypothetical protein
MVKPIQSRKEVKVAQAASLSARADEMISEATAVIYLRVSSDGLRRCCELERR